MAAYDYNALYKTTPDALGSAYDKLLDAITSHVTPPKRILDIGCGQGRDALPLARLGHSVTAVDAAPEGIRALEKNDVLLCNRTLHMLDEHDRHSVFKDLLDTVAANVFVFLVDEPSNMKNLIHILTETGRTQTILRQSGGDYFVQLDT